MTTLPLYLVDPPLAPAWAPFGGARPIAELRAGAWLVRERWERLLGCATQAILSEPCAGFVDTGTVPVQRPEPIAGPAVVVRSDLSPAATETMAMPPGGTRLVSGGQTMGHVLGVAEVWEPGRWPEATGVVEVPGLLLRGGFDLVTALETQLPADCAAYQALGGDPLPAGTIVLGDPAAVVLRGAGVEPGVVFDVRHGPVVLDGTAEVRHGTRLEGPCWVGRGARVLGGYVRNAIVGPMCVVRGEIAASVFVGYANKSHDGFVGHSVIGQWANLGAGTTTSNLKNTYGEVRPTVAGTVLATGRQFLGSLVGDHAKLAIGSMLSTGTVIGAGANVFGAPVPKYVAPFAWGLEGDGLTEDGFVAIAERVLPRRGIEVTEARRAWLRALHRRHAA